MLVALGVWCRNDGAAQRLLVDSLQQRLLDQQAAARQLREEIAANTVKERLAQEAEVKLLSEAQAFETEMQNLRAKLFEKCIDSIEVPLPPRMTLRARRSTLSSLRPQKAKGVYVLGGAGGQGVGSAERMDQEGADLNSE